MCGKYLFITGHLLVENRRACISLADMGWERPLRFYGGSVSLAPAALEGKIGNHRRVSSLRNRHYLAQIIAN